MEVGRHAARSSERIPPRSGLLFALTWLLVPVLTVYASALRDERFHGSALVLDGHPVDALRTCFFITQDGPGLDGALAQNTGLINGRYDALTHCLTILSGKDG